MRLPANTTPRDTEFSPSHILLGHAPRLLCFLKTDTDERGHSKEHTCHNSTPHNTREALLAIHKIQVQYREIRTSTEIEKVNKNRVPKQDTKYKPWDSVDFFKNMVNPQRTCGVIVEKVMHKQYKVSYGDNQYTKVTTSNMVPA